MKKLMFAASAALCATVGFAIESSNIVGYMDKSMDIKGYYNYTPMFVGVGNEAPAVRDIIPSTNDETVEDLGGGYIQLYVLDTNRKFAKTFAWMTEEDWMDEDGWYFGEEEEPTSYKLNPGESLQVYAPYQVTLTNAGQVDLSAYSFTAPEKGYYMVGNQHACDMAVKDIAPSTEDASVEDLGGGYIQLYVLDTNRKFAKTFAWMTEEDWMDEDGWYYGEEEEPTSYKLKPGEVLQFYAPYQVKLSFPSATL